MPIQHTCTIITKTALNPETFWMTLDTGAMVEKTFLAPGQFLHIKCGSSRILRRPISVCTCGSEKDGDLVDIVFQIRGEGTQWLAGHQEGDRLDVLGLLGNGFHMIPGGRYLLAGGGIGVPPLYGCAQFSEGRARAVLGFRSREQVILSDAFEKNCERVDLCTDDGTLGCHGFVDGQVRKILEQDKAFTQILACGSKPMLQSVAAVAAEFGIPCQVSMEERMACGIGACLGCAIRMKDGSMRHVCKDGPVFNAEEVDWNG